VLAATRLPALLALLSPSAHSAREPTDRSNAREKIAMRVASSTARPSPTECLRQSVSPDISAQPVGRARLGVAVQLP
jgi:hypothetical protein